MKCSEHKKGSHFKLTCILIRILTSKQLLTTYYIERRNVRFVCTFRKFVPTEKYDFVSLS